MIIVKKIAYWILLFLASFIIVVVVNSYLTRRKQNTNNMLRALQDKFDLLKSMRDSSECENEFNEAVNFQYELCNIQGIDPCFRTRLKYNNLIKLSLEFEKQIISCVKKANTG